MSEEKKRADVWRRDIGMGWLFRIEYDATWMNFKAYEVISHVLNPDGSHGPDEFHVAGSSFGADSTPDLEKAEVMLDGFVKWDGCCEIKMDEQPHFCGLDDMVEFHKACEAVMWIAAEHLTSFDRDCAGFPSARAAISADASPAGTTAGNPPGDPPAREP